MENAASGNASPLTAIHEALSLPAHLGLAGMSYQTDAIPGPAARRHQFQAGRRCAARALRLAGCPEMEERLHPAVGADRLPVWPHGWVGSISHTSRGAVAVAGSSARVGLLGIDMECWMSAETAVEVHAQVALPGELQVLPITSTPQALTLLFSAKEALYKALFPQVRAFFDFHAARVVSASADRLELQLCQSWGEVWPAGTVLSVGYAMTSLHVYTLLHEERIAPFRSDQFRLG